MINQVSATFALTAEKLLLDGQFEEAISTCEAGLALYPNYPSAMCILAKAYYFVGNFGAAESLISTAFEHFPTNLAIIKIKKAIFEQTLSIENNSIEIDENATVSDIESYNESNNIENENIENQLNEISEGTEMKIEIDENFNEEEKNIEEEFDIENNEENAEQSTVQEIEDNFVNDSIDEIFDEIPKDTDKNADENLEELDEIPESIDEDLEIIEDSENEESQYEDIVDVEEADSELEEVTVLEENLTDNNVDNNLLRINEIEKLTMALKNFDNSDDDDLMEEELSDNSLEEENLEESFEIERMDEETFFPKHTQQDSIAEMLNNDDNDNEYNEDNEIDDNEIIVDAEEPELTAETAEIEVEEETTVDNFDEITNDESADYAELEQAENIEDMTTEDIIEEAEDIEDMMTEDIIEETDNIEDIVTEDIIEEAENIDDGLNEYVEVKPIIIEEPAAVKLVSDLYHIDLELPRITAKTAIKKYPINHLDIAFDYSSINFFFNDYVFNKSENLTVAEDTIVNDIIIDNDVIDDKAQDFLNIAKGLENAKIASIVEDEIEEEECDAPLVASETMAKICTKQNAYSKAIKVYQMLIVEKPEKTDFYNEQIEFLQSELLQSEIVANN
jgi:hypothetical protein